MVEYINKGFVLICCILSCIFCHMLHILCHILHTYVPLWHIIYHILHIDLHILHRFHAAQGNWTPFTSPTGEEQCEIWNLCNLKICSRCMIHTIQNICEICIICTIHIIWKIWKICNIMIHFMPNVHKTKISSTKSCTWLSVLEVGVNKGIIVILGCHRWQHCRVSICCRVAATLARWCCLQRGGVVGAATLARSCSGAARGRRDAADGRRGGRVHSEQWSVGPLDSTDRTRVEGADAVLGQNAKVVGGCFPLPSPMINTGAVRCSSALCNTDCALTHHENRINITAVPLANMSTAGHGCRSESDGGIHQKRILF